MSTLVLVSCSGPKLAHAAPARDLYTSDLFKKSRAWAERNGDEWAILSAKHGLLSPDKPTEPYNVELSKLPAEARRAWARKVADQLRARGHRFHKIVVLAGKHYLRFAEHMPDTEVVDLFKGLELGERLSWLKKANAGLSGADDPQRGYLRFGDWNRRTEQSTNFSTGNQEFGVSVYEVVWNKQLGRWDIQIPSDSDNEYGPEDTLLGFIEQLRRGRSLGPIFLVDGNEVGVGHDGEPLLKGLREKERLELTQVACTKLRWIPDGQLSGLAGGCRWCSPRVR